MFSDRMALDIGVGTVNTAKHNVSMQGTKINKVVHFSDIQGPTLQTDLTFHLT